MRNFEFNVKIQMQWSATKAEAFRKFKAWLEHEGHTTPSFGFDLIETTHQKEKQQWQE
jgi:hypothetical protein